MNGLVFELPTCGWFAFRHPIVRQTLVESLLAIDRAWYHGHCGYRFAHYGDRDRAVYHLARSAKNIDRRQALGIGLDLCTTTDLPTPDNDLLETLDSLARSEQQNAERQGNPDRLTCRAALYLGWRSNQHGDRAAGQRWARTALELALAKVEEVQLRSASGSKRAEVMTDLGRAALNLTGFSPHPQPGGRLNFVRDHATLELLERAVSKLPATNAALPVIEIELEWLSSSLRPSNASLKKAKSLFEQAISLHDSTVAAMATHTFLQRFGRAVPTKSRVDRVHRVINDETALTERLMLAFVEHVALLELGQLPEATKLVDSLWTEAKTLGNRVDVAAARILAIRHYLWTGELAEAERRLIHYGTGGNSPPVDLAAVRVEQQAEVGRLLIRDDLIEATNNDLAMSTMEPATRAALYCHTGRLDRAGELLDQAVEQLTIGRSRSIDEAAIARIAVAAAALQRPEAAEAVVNLLGDLGDEILVSENNSVVLGPASYFFGLAASVVGEREMADNALEAAVGTSLTAGGKPLAVQALVAQARLAADYTDRDAVDGFLRKAKELAVTLDMRWLDRQVL